MDKETLRNLIKELLEEEQTGISVKLAKPLDIVVSEQDRLDTGNPGHRVYTHDLFALEDSPRLGCGVMEMEQSTFPWELQYDEIDYIISGTLTIYCGGHAVNANAGEVILIPKGSSILFSATERTRFLYVTYPADWKNK